MFRLSGEEFFGSGEETKERVALYELFEVRNASRLVLDEFSSRALFFLAFCPEFFGGFGGQE